MDKVLKNEHFFVVNFDIFVMCIFMLAEHNGLMSSKVIIIKINLKGI